MSNSLFRLRKIASKKTGCIFLPALPKKHSSDRASPAFISIAITILVSLITACASNEPLPDIELPSNAAAFNRTALKGDMLRAADLYIERKFGCDQWTLTQVSDSAAFGQLVFTREGQLYRGEISEKWDVMQCGTPLALRFRAEPTPEGSSLVRIRADQN